MILTERDNRLLLEIQNYGLLPTKTIAARHFDNAALTTVLRRLRKIEDVGYIKRIDGLENGSHAWCLSPAGASLLDDQPSKTNYPPQILKHDIALMKLRMRLEEIKIAQAWISEHVIRSRMARKRRYYDIREMIVPDGLMGITRTYNYKHAVAVELELTAKNQERYRNIVTEYQRRKAVWMVWYVVARPTIGKQIWKAVKSQRSKYLPYFTWSVLEDVMTDPLNAQIFGEHSGRSLEQVFLPRRSLRAS